VVPIYWVSCCGESFPSRAADHARTSIAFAAAGRIRASLHTFSHPPHLSFLNLRQEMASQHALTATIACLDSLDSINA